MNGPGLNEDAHILRQEHVLVEDDGATGDLPRAIDVPQHILPPTDVEVLFGLGPVSVHHEVRVDFEFSRGVPWLHFDIRNDVAGSRRRVLRPGIQYRTSSVKRSSRAWKRRSSSNRACRYRNCST